MKLICTEVYKTGIKVYKVIFDVFNPTVEEALQEIKEFTNKNTSFCRIKDYGCENADDYSCWGIYINNNIFISNWNGENNKNLFTYKYFYHGNQQEEVINCYGRGDWYCGINFYLTTE